jgi:hypothetical protein
MASAGTSKGKTSLVSLTLFKMNISIRPGHNGDPIEMNRIAKMICSAHPDGHATKK